MADSRLTTKTAPNIFSLGLKALKYCARHPLHSCVIALAMLPNPLLQVAASRDINLSDEFITVPDEAFLSQTPVFTYTNEAKSKTLDDIFPLEETVYASPELQQVLTSSEINVYLNKTRTVLSRLYNLGSANRKHIEYVLSTGVTIELTPEQPNNPGHAQYQGARHKVIVAIPHHLGSLQLAIKNIDDFSDRLFVLLMHEFQHATTAIMNSDANCNLLPEAQKFLQGLSNMPPTLPRNPQAIVEKVNKGHAYILDRLTKLSQKVGRFGDLTKKYSQQEAEKHFNKTDSLDDKVKAEKELAYVQYALKNYVPGRVTNVYRKNQLENSGILDKLKKGKPVQVTEGGRTVYVDTVTEKHGLFFLTGYRVVDPRNKINALIKDTDYKKNKMPQVYATQFSQSLNPKNKAASEIDAHVFEAGDLSILERLYPELMAEHEESKKKSPCQPQLKK
jgi:hypothetical protein